MYYSLLEIYFHGINQIKAYNTFNQIYRTVNVPDTVIPEEGSQNR